MRDVVIGAFAMPGVLPDASAPHNIWPAPADLAAVDGRKLRSAAVLVPLVDHAGGMTVILTRRCETLPAHAGQISFPGGGMTADDDSAEATALRETEEEIGLPRARVQLIGRLNAHDTGTGYRVMPVVAVVESPVAFAPDPSEVAEVFEVPVAHLLDDANHRFERRIARGVEREFRIIGWRDYFIWGLTARVLGELVDRLRAR